MDKYILPVVLTSCFTAVMTTFVKRVILKNKSKVNETVLRANAIVLSAAATILSWWILGVPEELKGCLLYFFPVYVLQEILDLDIIKRIIKAFIKAKLKKNGVEEDVGL